MGIFDRIRGQAAAQFLDVIEWVDDSRDTLLYRFPIHDRAITDQSKVIVREGQQALFIAEGALSEVFGPGTYTLDTPNAPILTFFRSIAYAMETPYKGDIVFVNTRQFTENRWGTQAPFPMRDAEFGPVRVRAFGTFSFRVTDAATFLREIAGTDGQLTTDEIVGQLKKRLVTQFATEVARSGVGVLDLAAHYVDLGERIGKEMSATFEASYGVAVTDLTIANIGMPEEVEKALDTRSRMGILGNLDQYTKLKAAEAIETAAANPGLAGGLAGAGVGLGLGQVVGQAVGGSMASGQAPPPPPASGWHYSGPSGQAQLSAADIAARVAAQRSATHHVWKPGMAGWQSWSDVPEIATLVPPPAAAPPPAPGASSWHYSGPDGQAELSTAEVVARVKAAPDASHHVWKTGFDGWKAPADVPEIAARLQGPPPPPAPNGPPPPPSAD